MRRVVYKKEPPTINIDECKQGSIYAYKSNNNIYTLKYDKRANLWYFSALHASTDYHEYENKTFHNTIRAAYDVNHDVFYFSNIASFAEWITELPIN